MRMFNFQPSAAILKQLVFTFCFKDMEPAGINLGALNPTAWHDLGKEVSFLGCLDPFQVNPELASWVYDLEHLSSQHLPWGPGKSIQDCLACCRILWKSLMKSWGEM